MSAISEQRSDVLIEARSVSKLFPGRKRLFGLRRREVVAAVDDVSLVIRRGETLGLVGESGSGKSTLGRALIYLRPPTRGTVVFEGNDLGEASPAEFRTLRRRLQIVFQDPYSSLHPRMTVRQTLLEALRLAECEDEDAEVMRLIRAVGLGAAHIDAYPFRLSGGQRQRVAIARALAMRPALIVADEAVSALDVSIQAQVLNLFADLQAERGLTYLFISHDLNVIRYLANRVAVMYRGRIVEIAPTDELFASARHPYTRVLLSAMPGRHQQSSSSALIRTAAAAGHGGCAFRACCQLASAECATRVPALRPAGPDHQVACHNVAVTA